MTLQPFDTDLFGFSVYRANLEKYSDISELNQSVPKDAGLVSIRIPLEWENAMRHTQFRKIENLVYFERSFEAKEEMALQSSVRLASKYDADACSNIAQSCFSHDRYHTDKYLDNKIADQSKYTWAQNNILRRADTSFVAELENQIVGFISCLREAKTAIIDLIGVSTEAQGKGIGTKLVKAVISHYANSVSTIKVGTQTNNKASIKLYNSTGFKKVDEVITFHWTPKNIEAI
jgi:ribosomal protein S18 acetylase RimI-like enzyme